jgi:hypothetical protein
MKKVARPGGLELPTFWFVARRSIQLSYGRVAEEILAHARKLSPPRSLLTLLQTSLRDKH